MSRTGLRPVGYLERLGLMRQITIGRILSLLIAIGYATCMIIGAHGFTEDVFKGCMVLLFPLALIWFPEQIGDATGYFAGHMMRVDAPTPPVLISIMGWLFLVGLPVLFYFIT
jgi:hypothetical protein